MIAINDKAFPWLAWKFKSSSFLVFFCSENFSEPWKIFVSNCKQKIGKLESEYLEQYKNSSRCGHDQVHVCF